MLLGQVVSGASRYSTLKMTTPHSTAVQPMCLSRLTQIRRLPRDIVYLGWPIATSYMNPNAEGGSCGVSANEYSCTQGAQINFGDLNPYLTYGRVVRESDRQCLSRYLTGVDPSILRHSEIWVAADEAVLKKYWKILKNIPLFAKRFFQLLCR